MAGMNDALFDNVSAHEPCHLKRILRRARPDDASSFPHLKTSAISVSSCHRLIFRVSARISYLSEDHCEGYISYHMSSHRSTPCTESYSNSGFTFLTFLHTLDSRDARTSSSSFFSLPSLIVTGPHLRLRSGTFNNTPHYHTVK